MVVFLAQDANRASVDAAGFLASHTALAGGSGSAAKVQAQPLVFAKMVV